jgi:tetratricopeptide (TPR) repeat protein
MTGEVDERSDVYALGVLMYELLIGTAPFDAARLRQAGLSEMLRIIREEEAPPLSKRLTALGAAATEIAARRQTDAASLTRLVEGDLTWIAMKALDKARERRYASAADLAADIQRSLEHRPVLASPPSRVDRARKFLRRNRPVAFGTAAAFAVIASTGVTMWSLARRDAASRLTLTEKDTIVLADFTNQTGDPVFDDTLRQGVSVELRQSPFLTLISQAQVQQTLALMGHSKEARLTPVIAQQICERTGSAATLEGSIASLGGQYVLGLRARNCSTGALLDQQQIQAPRREDVLDSLSEIARTFRIRAGESLATVERYSTPLVQATTASLEALKAYSTGRTVIFSGDRRAGIPLLQRAVELDPQFALAHAFLGFNYSSIGESELAAKYATRAWELRERVSDRERFFIDFTYHRQVTGDLEKAYQTLEAWLQAYPRGPHDADPGANPQGLLGGLATHGTGRWQRATEAIQKELELSPDFPIAYQRLVQTDLLLDRVAEAERGLQRAAERKLEMPNFVAFRYTIGVMKGDQEQMSRAIAEAQGKRLAEHWVAHLESLVLARSGRLQAARRSSTRAVDLAQQEGTREMAAKYQAARAVWEAACGNVAEARKSAITALERSNGRDVEFTAALAHELSGGSPQSEALADDLDKRFPEDTFAKFTHVPVLRGLAALRRGKPAESVELLQTALRYELAVNGLNFPEFYLGGLYPAYVRGEALMAMRRHAEAAAEFQKILDHRGLVGLDPIGTLAHLQLGRALAMSRDTTKARAAYDQFFALWKDADLDVPILKNAKAEYGRLR